MSLFNKDYNSGGSNDNDADDNDYDDNDSLKLANYAIVSFELDRLASFTGSEYGQSVIVDLNDVRVKHGLAYDRFYSDDDDTKKVFGFGKWFQTNADGTLAEDVDEDLINKRISEEFGGNQYPYEYEGHTTEENDDDLEMGDLTMWLNNATKTRTFLKVITDAGHDIVADKDDDHDWADDDALNIRDDLQGRRITLFYKKDTFKPDDGDEVTYTDAVVLDEDTEAPITIQNGSTGSSTSSDNDQGESGTLGGTNADDLPEGVPEEADEIIDFMARTEETDPESVEQLVQGEADDYDLDAVVGEVERRIA